MTDHLKMLVDDRLVSIITVHATDHLKMLVNDRLITTRCSLTIDLNVLSGEP